jgi:hypothetical protein
MKVLVKGAKAQPSCALFCRLFHALIGEAINPEGFHRLWAPRTRALAKELERATVGLYKLNAVEP